MVGKGVSEMRGWCKLLLCDGVVVVVVVVS